MEPGTMKRPPRKMGATFLSFKQLLISIIQGLMITTGCLGIGYIYMQQGNDEPTIRTVIFITLLFSNIFLTLVNRSFSLSVLKTLSYKNNLVPLIIGITLIFIACLLYVPFIQNLFRLHSLTIGMLIVCIITGLISTFWIEIWKIFKR